MFVWPINIVGLPFLRPSPLLLFFSLCHQLDTLERGQLASRLTMNCTDNYVEPQKLKDVTVTIMDVSIFSFLPQCVYVCVNALH